MHYCRPNLTLSSLALDKDCVSKLPESVIIAGSTITTTDELKILGVVLDSSLTLDQHVLNTVMNCNFHLRALRHIRSFLFSNPGRCKHNDILYYWFQN